MISSVLKFFFNNKARLRKELNEAHAELEPLSTDLVNWEKDELELMSLIQVDRKMKSAFSNSVEGIICSIYHEHMISYLWKKLASINNTSIIVAKTAKFKFDMVVKNEQCSFYVNDQYLGDFKKDNKLYLSKNKILATLDESSAEWWAIKVENDFIGSITNIEKARRVSPRAFQLRRNLSEIDEAVLLSIAIYIIIEKTRKMKKIPFE